MFPAIFSSKASWSVLDLDSLVLLVLLLVIDYCPLCLLDHFSTKESLSLLFLSLQELVSHLSLLSLLVLLVHSFFANLVFDQNYTKYHFHDWYNNWILKLILRPISIFSSSLTTEGLAGLIRCGSKVRLVEPLQQLPIFFVWVFYLSCVLISFGELLDYDSYYYAIFNNNIK